MGLPKITIEFIRKAVQSIKVGAGGIVGIILKDEVHNGALILKDITDIPTDFSAKNKAYIERAFTGVPKRVIVYTLPQEAENLADACKYFKINRANYICGTPDITQEEAEFLASWCKSVRASTPNRPVVVVPNVKGDHPGVINFVVLGATADDCIKVGDENFTAAEYCSRIAGLLAGLALTVSATYKPLLEVTSIPEVDDEEVDTAVDEGKLVLYNNGDDIVIARGVTSLVTVTEEYTEDLKKIKIVAIQDLIETDIYSTINKSYIGNYTNSYDNKCLLMVAIGAYLKKLDTSEGGAGYINEGSTMEIDIDAQRIYLEGIGTDTSDMDDQAIKEANTGSFVFLVGSVSILDAIEDVTIRINKV